MFSHAGLDSSVGIIERCTRIADLQVDINPRYCDSKIEWFGDNDL
jgi:hypothetical protein